MAMATVDTIMPLSRAGWWKGVASGSMPVWNVEKPRCVRIGQVTQCQVERGGKELVLASSKTFEAATSARVDDKKMIDVTSAIADNVHRGLETMNLPVESNEAFNTEIKGEVCTEDYLQQYPALNNAVSKRQYENVWPPGDQACAILSKEYRASQHFSLSSTAIKESIGNSMSLLRATENAEESASRTGRRVFSMCLWGLIAFTFTGEGSESVAVESQSKPKKVQGRPPSSRYDEDRLLEQNRRMQKLNNAPAEFPGFVREGFQVKVVTSNKYVTTKTGLIYYDMVIGEGDLPQDGQQVIFHYTGYNESGRRVDSSYQQGRPSRTRLGINGMIPGFEEGIKTMRAGGRRILIVPPELGPPVGPSTFFSAKQFEVFDVELLEAKDCNRRTLLFYSDVVCD